MKLTTKGRFAVTAMLDIALQAPEEFVTLTEIGERRHLSISYLEQLFGKLRKAGLVVGNRGPKGGYRLSKPSSEIKVDEILDAVDSTLKTSACTKSRGSLCDGEGECITFDLWDNLNKEMRKFLHGISLADLAEKKQLKDHGIHPVQILKKSTNSSRHNGV